MSFVPMRFDAEGIKTYSNKCVIELVKRLYFCPAVSPCNASLESPKRISTFIRETQMLYFLASRRVWALACSSWVRVGSLRAAPDSCACLLAARPSWRLARRWPARTWSVPAGAHSLLPLLVHGARCSGCKACYLRVHGCCSAVLV